MLTLRTCSLVLLVACLPANDLNVRTSEIDDRAPRDTGDDYDFQHVAVDGYVQQKPGFYAVRTASDWRGAWTENAKGDVPPVPPDLDFKKRMLFVATSKTAGAKSIEVQKITRTFDGLHIYVIETLLPRTCPAGPPAKAVPMDIVSLDNVPFDMHVVYDRVHADSCGPPPDAVVACRIAGSGSAGSDKITAAPGEVVDCDSSQSRAQAGAITERKWQLNVKPPGSSAKLTVGKGSIGVTFPVDAWGVYQVGLDIRDATREGSGLGIVEMLPPDSGVELYLNHAENVDPATLPRVELHVVELGLGLGSGGDCAILSQKSWCEMHTAVGLQEGMLSPEKNKRYRVVVKYLDARLPGTPVVCVRAFAKGVQPVSTCDAEDAQRARNATWELGALDVPHAVFYDARLSKPPTPVTPSAEGTAAVPTATATHTPPPPTATATHHAPPPPPTSSASVIEL
jgi:hypothetical protein